MLAPVSTQARSLSDYRPLIGDGKADEILALSQRLEGVRVLHLNASPFGGGVAEVLSSLVPLMSDVGLLTEWRVISGSPEFFTVTKSLHNSLQGMSLQWTDSMWEVWQRYNKVNAKSLEGQYDFVVVHDPQPAGLLHYYLLNGHNGKGQGKWIWRCHLDLTATQPLVWERLHTYLQTFDATIFSLPAYIPGDCVLPRPFAMPPAIDPLSQKNRPVSSGTIKEVLARFDVDPQRPVLLQAARLDPWKDPLGVIDVYEGVKRHVPGLQLVYLAAMASDDPEGWTYYRLTTERAGSDPDIHILPNVLHGIGDLEVNAFQSGASVVLQKSTREGFGLSVSEALWKGRPVVAGNAGGIPLQVIDGQTGFLVSDTSECIERVCYLLKHPDVAERLGRAGREHVKENFLITRLLRDYLTIFFELRGMPGEG